MPCCCRQSYVVNRDDKKKDNSFKLFITFLLAVLLVYLVIYALILTLTKKKEDERENEESSTKPIIESSTIFYLLQQKGVNSTDATIIDEDGSTTEKSKKKDTTRAENTLQTNTNKASTTEDSSKFVTNSWPFIKTEPATATTEKENESSSTINEENSTNEDAVSASTINEDPVSTSTIIDKHTATSTEVFTQSQPEFTKQNTVLIAEKYIIESTLAATKLALVTATTDKANIEKIVIEHANKTTTEEIITCHSPGCKMTAIDLLKKIDFSIDPCEDFYQFSCGNEVTASAEDFQVFFEEIQNPEDEGLRSFGNFFHSCVAYRTEYGSFDTIKQVLSITIRSSNLTTLLGFLLLRQSTPLFEIVEGRNGEIQILPPSSYDTDILENWSLKTHIHKRCLSTQNLNDYKQCQNETLYKMLSNLHSFKMNDKTTKPDFDFMLNSIKQQIPSIDIQEALVKKSCQKVDVLQLNKDYPVIDWKVLLGTITETSSKSICLYFKSDYFDPIMTDLGVRMARNESQILNSIREYFQLQLYENLMSQQNDRFCMKRATELMPEIAEKILQRRVSDAILQLLEVMFKELKDKFYWLIEISKLKEDDKSLFKNQLKLLKMTFNDDKFAEDYHADFTQDYLTKLFMLLEDRRTIRNKGKSAKLSAGKMDLINDTIIIPYSLIYKATIRKRRPDFYMKFHLSRAIAEYFNQLAKEERNSFYEAFQKSLNTNLENKLEEKWSKLVAVSTFERTADSLALQIAFDSYFPRNGSKEKLPWISEAYTDEQQFYLLISQDICDSSSLQTRIVEETRNLPAKFRIEAMLTNSNNFAKSFSCPMGSGMNPADEKIEFDQFEFEEEYESGDQAYK